MEPTTPTTAPTKLPTTETSDSEGGMAAAGGGIGGFCICCCVCLAIYGMCNRESDGSSEDNSGYSGPVTKTSNSTGTVCRYELPDGHMDKNVSDRYLCTEIA